MSSESLDELLAQLVVDARKREADTRKAARPPSPSDQLAIEALDRVSKTFDVNLIGAVSEQGARDSQEDRFTVIPSLVELYPQISARFSYFAVFDGHEGAACAEYARCYLHSHIVKHDTFPADISVAVKAGFKSTDLGFLGPAVPPEDPLSLQYTSGSTAVCAIIDHDRRRLVVGHVGDSRALLARRDGSVLQLTQDHTGRSLSAEEREEIRVSQVAMVIGSYIWITTGGDSQRINRHSVSLEVSRAFGDPLFKYGYNPMLLDHGKDIISSTPDISEVLLQDTDSGGVLLLASDGLFKSLSNERCGEICRHATDLQAAANQLAREAIEARCGDNTTVVLARLVL